MFLALAVFALLILIALTRLPESAPASGSERLTVGSILRAFATMLSRRAFLGYQMAGSFSFAALFCYLSTVAYFLPDVFNIPTSLFGYAFALTVLGFMTGSLINARVVMHYGLDTTLRAGLLISLCSAISIASLAPWASQYLYTMACLSALFFLGVGFDGRQCIHGRNFAVPYASRCRLGCLRLYPCFTRIADRRDGGGAVSRSTTGACAGYSGLLYHRHFRPAPDAT